MKPKTEVHAEEGKQDLLITREFDLPLSLLFKAHTDPELLEQWMSHEYGTCKILKFEARKHGGWQYETVDAQGNVLFKANGVIHELLPDQRITRTFEMENTDFPVQLEFLEFEERPGNTSKLTMQIIFRSVGFRDKLLKMPFAFGLNMAHNRLEEIIGKLK